MAVNLQKGQRVSLDSSMRLALVGLGWDTNRYDGGYDFDLDEVYKYVKNTRTNVNKKLNALKKQIEEQDEKIDKIIMLLEEKDKE